MCGTRRPSGFARLRQALAAGLLGLIGIGLAPSWAAAPVYIAFDGAYGVKTNTAPKAIERGILAAMDEIKFGAVLAKIACMAAWDST